MQYPTWSAFVKAYTLAIYHSDVQHAHHMDEHGPLLQGDCQTEFEDGTDSFTAVLPELDPALVARKPGQCAIIADKTIFEIQLQGGVISMSNLYLRMHRRESTQQNQVRIVNFNGVSAWLTNMTVQGDAGQSQALYPFEDAQVYVQGAVSFS